MLTQPGAERKLRGNAVELVPQPGVGTFAERVLERQPPQHVAERTGRDEGRRVDDLAFCEQTTHPQPVSELFGSGDVVLGEVRDLGVDEVLHEIEWRGRGGTPAGLEARADLRHLLQDNGGAYNTCYTIM